MATLPIGNLRLKLFVTLQVVDLGRRLQVPSRIPARSTSKLATGAERGRGAYQHDVSIGGMAL